MVLALSFNSRINSLRIDNRALARPPANGGLTLELVRLYIGPDIHRDNSCFYASSVAVSNGTSAQASRGQPKSLDWYWYLCVDIYNYRLERAAVKNGTLLGVSRLSIDHAQLEGRNLLSRTFSRHSGSMFWRLPKYIGGKNGLGGDHKFRYIWPRPWPVPERRIFDRLAGRRHTWLYRPDWLLGRVQDQEPIGPNPDAQPWEFN